MRTAFALLVAFSMVASVSADVVDFDVTGILSMDLEADVDNEVYIVDIASAIGLPAGTAVEMDGIGWDVTLTTYDISWLSEATVYFDDTINPDGSGLYLSVGAGDDLGGSETYSSGGIINFSDVGIANILLPDGTLRLEFFEGWDDVADGADAIFDSGVLNIQVTPEPASMVLLALGALTMIRRR